jgi:hypothetical protein
MADKVTTKTRPRKPTARQAFELNIADANMLVALAKLLQNQRSRKMRVELQRKIGSALGIAAKCQADLDCLQNDQVFVTFLPGHADWRGRLTEEKLRPLLRQALVAACAAVETFCADRVMELYPRALQERVSRLLLLPMTIGDWERIEASYTRERWGIRKMVEEHIRVKASPAPAQIGELFALVGITGLFPKIDTYRKVGKGSSTEALDRIVNRRNVIAHTGDRKGRGRAVITVAEVEADLRCLKEIIEGLDSTTAPG